MNIQPIKLGYITLIPSIAIGKNSFDGGWWLRIDWLFWGIEFGQDDLDKVEEMIKKDRS